MEQSLHRLLRSETYFYCIVLLGFAVAEFVNRAFIMAGALLLAAVVMLVLTLVLSRVRARAVQRYIQQSVDLLSGSVMASVPFPLLTVRLSDGEVLWHNRQLQQTLGVKESYIGESFRRH